jgi:histidinol-phosphatase (PHP family)
MLDYHIHSNFSFDSKAQPQEICQAALSLGIDEIAITDHFSFAPYSPNFRFFDLEDYFRVWTKLQKEFSPNLTIRIGIELDEIANFPKESDELVRSYPWDFVIGSTHDLECGTLRTYLRKYENQEKVIRAYYEALVAAIEIGNFDILAHFDLIKRYIVDEGLTLMNSEPFSAQIDHLFTLLIEREIVLEINTSGIFQACKDPFPSLALLKRYYQLGGRLITLGSDAHAAKDLARGFDQVIPKSKEIGFSGLVNFQQRKKRIQLW